MTPGLTLKPLSPEIKGRLWPSMDDLFLFILSVLGGITVSGLWIFKYGVTTENITNGDRIDNANKQNLIIAGSVLTVLSTLAIVFTIYKLHSDNNNEKKIVTKKVTG